MDWEQRVAPGVPPQHYQPPPQQQQQHFQHQQFDSFQQPHHIPVQQQQFQQIPVQPVPQHQLPMQHQVPVQQMPQVQHHGTPQQHGDQGSHHPSGQILNAANMAHEKDHLADHLSVPIDTSKMTEQELQFHYFKMHDADNNNKLDGCELIKSLIHWHESGHKDPNNPNAQIHEKIFGDEELIGLIDPIFAVDDSNNDGYIDYPEFIRAQQKAAAKPSP